MGSFYLKRLCCAALTVTFALTGCSGGGMEPARLTVPDTVRQETPASVPPAPEDARDPEQPVVIAESADKTVSVLADSPAAGGNTFQGITVRINGQIKRFEWQNVANPSYFPRVWTVNLDEEPDEEAVIVLTAGYGTGYSKSRVHVLKRDFREIPAEDAVGKVRMLAVTRSEMEPAARIFTLEVGGETHTFTYPEGDAGFWFDDIVFGNITQYEVKDGKLVAEVSVQVSPGEFPGTVVCQYTYRDGKFAVSEVKFTPSSRS